MSKIAIIIVFLVTSWNIILAQDSISARDIVQRYIEAIGGFDKIESVHSLEKIETESYRGQQSIINIKARIDGYFLLEKNAPLDQAKAIVKEGEGVNITPEGIFSMSPVQVVRYQEDAGIFPEFFYLKNDYPLSFHGIYNLDGETPCYEIGIMLPDSNIIFKEYNVKSGLLELVVNKNQRTRILDYKEVGGIKFPSKYKLNQLTVTNDSITINPDLDEKSFNWNTAADLALIGRWEAELENPEGQSQIFYLEFQSNRGGREGVGVSVKEKFEEAGFMQQSIVGWAIQDDSIKLQYYNPQNRKLWTKYLVIEERKEDRIIGYMSDPELDEKFGAKPVALTFKKVK
ncbi:MAG: hypothetical protein AAGG68_15145 [Bacteroidota bacterium]